MISVAEFRARCRTDAAENIVDDVLLVDEALHISGENRTFLGRSLATKFGIAEDELRLYIVGSAKLGFSITEKWKDGRHYPRYRPYSGVSDVDVAVVSPVLFRLIWDDLSIYAHGQSWFPWKSRSLGDYFVYGWLRPDHFPKARIRACDNWWDQFRWFSSLPRFGRRAVRGGLFHSTADLHRYQRRAVIDCINNEQSLI